MDRGEIRWYRFTGPDKTRPVLILTRSSVSEYLGEVTVAPITTNIRDIPSEVLLTEEDGMPRPCAINLDHVQTVPRDKIGALITNLMADRMDEVRAALLFALGFDE
jgi:mRNA interferase MazF